MASNKRVFLVTVNGRAKHPRGLLSTDELFQKAVHLAEHRTAFALPPRDGKPLYGLIAAGCYNYFDPVIFRMSIPESENVRQPTVVELVHPGEEVTTPAAWQLLQAAGFTPVDIITLLRFGAAYPEEQRKYGDGAIVALGSSVVLPSGIHGIPCLHTLSGRDRALRLYRAEGSWREEDRFLVISKPA